MDQKKNLPFNIQHLNFWRSTESTCFRRRRLLAVQASTAILPSSRRSPIHSLRTNRSNLHQYCSRWNSNMRGTNMNNFHVVQTRCSSSATLAGFLEDAHENRKCSHHNSQHRIKSIASTPINPQNAGGIQFAYGPRLYVCQAPNAFICVSSVAPPKHQMHLYVCHQMRLYVCHQMRLLNPQHNGARFARLPLLASLARFLTV